MIFEREVKQQVEVTTLHASIGVRYWEDASVNGMTDDEDDPAMPLIRDGRWELMIDLATGRIDGWPKGTTADTYYKVCDDGVYRLLAQNGDEVCKRDGYVPDMLAPKEDGYGDYVILTIGADGIIEGWRAELSYFQRSEASE